MGQCLTMQLCELEEHGIVDRKVYSQVPHKVEYSLSELGILNESVLRESAFIGAMLFGSFSAFWTTLVFLLEKPPYHYGSEVAGLFSLVGVGGALAAPMIGKLADRKNPKLTVGLGIAITTASFLVFWLFGTHLIGLTIGVILLDLGVQSGHVSNQTRIYSLLPQARSRLNMIYMVCYFLGGGLGSSLGAYAWSIWRWFGVCAVGLLMMLIAVFVYFGSGKLKLRH
jgi:predicted MFS family arabinose efflux permease